MSKAQQDQFIDDDEEESCPLCVEDFDLDDKSFRPCPCGYQVCRFCYNNVKNNMNGRCPACRRPYNDEDIVLEPITAEEQAAYKARQAQKHKKTQAALQKEKQKVEADNLSRKHLAGLRVVQKNLVYVTGLSPNFQEDKLLATLRGNEYFGQYGKIIKIVVSKAKDISHPQSVGVYVTYERKEDAATCIAMVNGTQNGERTLRAQYGTTKYCSAYLRGETCTNRQCMFLHEPGEAGESYSREGLSALNAGSSQSSSRPPPQSQQPVASASASQPMARQSSGDRPESPAVARPALPSTASWASRPPNTLPVRSESRSTSTTMDSPAVAHATPAQTAPEPTQEQAAAPAPAPETTAQPASKPPKPRRPREVSPLVALVKNFHIDDLKFAFSVSALPQADLDAIDRYPPLFDKNGGARRRQRRLREEEERRTEEEAAQAFRQPPTLDTDDSAGLGGSLQLGGEPEDRASLSQPTSAIQPPGTDGLLDQRFQFGGISSPVSDGRGMTQQQQQQLLLMKGQGGQGSYLNSNQPSSFQQPNHPPGHQRNASRYSFANESSASTSVKPVANAKLLNQQSSIMPPTGGNHFSAQHQPHGNQFYTSNVQGPPPGLKTTGTPPVSGGMTFGQGHGFATGGLQYGANVGGRNANEEMMRNLLRTRGDGGDASKREFGSFSNYPTAHSTASFHNASGQGNPSFPTGPPSYASLSSFSGEEKQRKKKSKKHRHAQTSSSSGGAGLVDPANDASHLLQSRFAQGGGFGGSQAAGAGGGGGGLYGGMHGGNGYGGRW
ncbi:transcriptional repressor general negative regulator of transcription subunit 4 [Saxophila tyrrhenica]|uniref:Transcriptional repressor general negative regulator of transcription subunit 4 n=1 Tax=Saxophila tyrrhenica TaxID=1690608 RepID=A0AAV9NYD1_9PEZI|nr:transcriptional repressor general negative regulator of transcription subunit 4 [Saxophila tyrrhenica]